VVVPCVDALATTGPRPARLKAAPLGPSRGASSRRLSTHRRPGGARAEPRGSWGGWRDAGRTGRRGAGTARRGRQTISISGI
jgi:hypothetical protein